VFSLYVRYESSLLGGLLIRCRKYIETLLNAIMFVGLEINKENISIYDAVQNHNTKAAKNLSML
jgi:hypothetical protein